MLGWKPVSHSVSLMFVKLVVFLQHSTGIRCIITVVTFDVCVYTDTGQFSASVLVWNGPGIFSQAHFRQVTNVFIH